MPANANSASLQNALPRREVFLFEKEEGGLVMDFRLYFKGHLPAETNSPRTKDKHRIRRYFHPQLRELWNTHPNLKEQMRRPLLLDEVDESQAGGDGRRQARWHPSGKPWIEHLAEEYNRDGFRYIPLVRKNGLQCSLDILFLRRDPPGGIVSRGGGDIDNRIKVLFDALRITENASELCGAKPEDGEDPFFCLLEDDSLISEVTITTDRLLTPREGGEAINDVLMVIHVKVSDPGSIFAAGRLV
jgi:hypothetical protein